MAAGTISHVGGTSAALLIRWVPGAGASTATLQAYRMDTGAVTSVALTSGTNTVTTLSAGVQYALVAVAYDESGDYDSLSNVVLMRVPQSGEGTDFCVEWMVDKDSDWRNSDTGYDIDLTRVRILPNVNGHGFKWKISGDGQNHRMILRSVAMEVRMLGEAPSAVQTT